MTLGDDDDHNNDKDGDEKYNHNTSNYDDHHHDGPYFLWSVFTATAAYPQMCQALFCDSSK